MSADRARHWVWVISGLMFVLAAEALGFEIDEHSHRDLDCRQYSRSYSHAHRTCVQLALP